MLTQIIIISLLVRAIHYTMQEGEIFGKLGDWFEKNTPESIHPPLFGCNVCMTPWYGSVLFLIIYGPSLAWPIVVIAAMGLQSAINLLNHD